VLFESLAVSFKGLWLGLAERSLESIERQLRRVSGSLRQAADRGNHIVTPQLQAFPRRLSSDQFGERRGASHGRDASLGLKSNISDLAALQFQGQADDIPADRILDLGRAIGVGEIARIARILKVIEQLRGIHALRF